jgi:hypothetical protein
MIYYRDGYKYQLTRDYSVQIGIRPLAFIYTPFVRLDTDGMLHLVSGYAWDGPSGPAIDTPNFMRGSLVHDALYQLMRLGRLNSDVHRKTADEELRRICKEDGMSSLRAWWVYNGVRIGGGALAISGADLPDKTAP